MKGRQYLCRSIALAFCVFAILCKGVQAQLGVLDSTYIIFHFHGTDSTSRLGAGGIVSLGDINADGFDDIAIGSFSPVGTYIFYGGDPADTVPDMFLRGAFPFRPIDVTGDGVDDMITRHGFILDGHGSGKLFFYEGHPGSISSNPYDSLFPKLDTVGDFATNWNFGIRGQNQGFVYADADSLGDLLTSKPDALYGPILYYYSGPPAIDTVADWSFREGYYGHLMSCFGFIDFDGDGEQDVFVGAAVRLDTVSYVYIFRGPQYGPSPDVVIADPADLDTLDRERFAEGVWNIGDVNGDGWEDLGVRYSSAGLIYFCGPGADTLYDIKLQYKVRYMSAAGDVNGDGYNDLIAGSIVDDLGSVFLYVGGPRFDGYLDDGLGYYDLPPFYLDMIGHRTAPAGDFNGDGIDDFMFACQNFADGEPGDVFVIRGSRSIVTDVDEDTGPVVPEGLRLQQNYPNPFNSSTAIEFTLRQRQNVTLDIYNILGRHVRTLLNNENLPAGQHRMTWDGSGDDGTPVASGVYLYRLTAGDFVQTRKMELVK